MDGWMDGLDFPPARPGHGESRALCPAPCRGDVMLPGRSWEVMLQPGQQRWARVTSGGSTGLGTRLFPKEWSVSHLSATVLGPFPPGVVSIPLALSSKPWLWRSSDGDYAPVLPLRMNISTSKAGRAALFQAAAFPRMLMRKPCRERTATGLKYEGGERATRADSHFPGERGKPSLRFKTQPMARMWEEPLPSKLHYTFCDGTDLKPSPAVL